MLFLPEEIGLSTPANIISFVQRTCPICYSFSFRFIFFPLLFSRGFQLRARVCHQDGDIFSYKTIHSVNKINSLFYRLQYWQDTAFYPVTHRLQSMYLTPLKGHALCTWRFAIGTLMSTIQLIKFPGPAFSKSN